MVQAQWQTLLNDFFKPCTRGWHLCTPCTRHHQLALYPRGAITHNACPTVLPGLQGRQEDLASVVRHVKEEFGVEFVYCWHALHSYWSGVSPDAPGTQSYGSQITHPTATPGNAWLLPAGNIVPYPCSWYACAHGHSICYSAVLSIGFVET